MTAIIHDTRPTRNAIIALLQTKCETRKTARPNISIPKSVKTTAMPSKDGEPPGYEEDIEKSEQNADPPHEREALLERGELVPHSLVAGRELGEPLEDLSE